MIQRMPLPTGEGSFVRRMERRRSIHSRMSLPRAAAAELPLLELARLTFFDEVSFLFERRLAIHSPVLRNHELSGAGSYVQSSSTIRMNALLGLCHSSMLCDQLCGLVLAGDLIRATQRIAYLGTSTPLNKRRPHPRGRPGRTCLTCENACLAGRHIGALFGSAGAGAPSLGRMRTVTVGRW